LGEKSKLFLVFCLHRSGSSATAGVMNLLGINMGDKLLPATKNNPKGHFENAEFVQLNQEILRSVNSFWYKPPSREKIANANFPPAKLKAFLEKHKKPVWGLKDPRTLFTYEIWKPFMEEVAEITYVFVHRPFQSSVRSLAHRDRMGVGQASQILIPYLVNLYNFRHNYNLGPGEMIDVYYQDLLTNPEPFVKKFNEKIGNPPDYQLNKVKEFLDEKLKNF
jgi:hypothetical protein